MAPDSHHLDASTERLRELVCDAVRRLMERGEWPGYGSGPTVVTAAEVEAARGAELRLPPGAVITPEARDRARDLGVRLLQGRSSAPRLGNAERRLADRLADQLGRDLEVGEVQDLAFWCWNEGACADPRRLEAIVDAGADRVGMTTCAPPLDDAITHLIDHTLLKPEATEQQVRRLCDEALEYGFASVCVNPYYVPLVADTLRGSPVRACTVVGFPLGANMPETKAAEARLAVQQGATEIDMVLNVGALKSGRDDWVSWDIEQVVEAGRTTALVKVILETALLDDEEIVRACRLAREAGAEFVKTSTGFGPGGATTDDVALMRRTVGREMGVKASGGIGSRREAAEMIAAGATRIGASAGVRIARGE